MYAFSYEVPGNREFFDRISCELGEAPDSLLLHLVEESPRGLRHINVWTSRQDWEAYREQRVRPTVAKVLAEAGIPEPPTPREEPVKVMGLFARNLLEFSASSS